MKYALTLLSAAALCACASTPKADLQTPEFYKPVEKHVVYMSNPSLAIAPDASDKPISYEVRPGSLKNNIEEMMALYGFEKVVFDKSLSCIDFRTHTAYTVSGKNLPDLLDHLIDGFPIVAAIHKPDRIAVVSASPFIAGKCQQGDSHAS